MASAEEPRGSKFLSFFGLETNDKALGALLWASPYLLSLVVALAGLSYVVHQFLPLRPLVYVIAILFSLLYFFFFLARMRQMSLQAQDREDQ